MPPSTHQQQPLVLLSILALPLALAAYPVLAESTTELNAVLVNADIDEPQAETESSESLLNTSNSETGSALRQMSGVEASRMGGHGVDLVIRGQSASQLNVVIDGAKIEGGCPNRMDPPTAYAEMSSFDEVTVIKGVNSVTYGVGGSGGTVLFKRHAPTFDDGKSIQGEVNMGTSSNGLNKEANATMSAGGDKGYIVLQGARKSAKSYIDGNGRTVNSSYESQQGHIDLGWIPDENNELRLSYEQTVTEDALFQGSTMDAPLSDGKTSRLQYRGADLTPSIQSLDIDLYNSTVNHIMNNYELRALTAPTEAETITEVGTQGAKIKLSSQIGQTELTYGVQIESVNKLASSININADDKIVQYMWPEVVTQTNSLFAESTSHFQDRQKVIIGLRLDQVSTEAKKAYTPPELGTKIAAPLYAATYTAYSGRTQTDDNSLNALLRYERIYNGNLNLFAGISRTHRYPDATEQYIAKNAYTAAVDRSWVGNPDLKPEQHNQIDIGLSQANKNSQWSVTAYFDAISNYILRDLAKNQSIDDISATSATLDMRNIYLNRAANIYGLDITARLKATQRITVGALASLSKGRNTTEGRNLSNIAPLSGNLYAQYAQNNWDLATRFNFATKQTDVNSLYGEVETPAWSTLDFYSTVQVNKSIRLSAGVDNIFDHAYEGFLNRIDPDSGNTYKLYEPGRTVWAKLNAQF